MNVAIVSGLVCADFQIDSGSQRSMEVLKKQLLRCCCFFSVETLSIASLFFVGFLLLCFGCMCVCVCVCV